MVILAVDDDPLVPINTVMMLKDMGHTVVEANSGAQALDVLEHQPIELLITDQAMPRMTGMQLVEDVAKRWPHIPVIIATGYAELPKDGEALPLIRLSKPLTESELADAVRNAMHGRSA